MIIKDLFIKPVDRPIDGVIKADDTRNLSVELDEYVITREVSKGLGLLADRYNSERDTNGVWISGFFGSGKSHLLKILSMVLDGASLPDGRIPADIILSKIDDEIVRGDLFKASRVPSKSILFNIDQKFDGIGGDHTAPILEVFIKVLNELQGYYGKQGYIARFERDLDMHGDFAPFKETYLRVNKSTWDKDRESIGTARKAAFCKAYAAHFGVDESEATNLLRQVREDYRVSVESFAQMVKDYIARQPPGFRLNFFVDEVGQFIGQDSKLMLNLQTVAETLATVCKGQSWIFVTSQADLQGILGNIKTFQAQDISKISGRFKTQITLTGSDVREVIQKRLLAKKEDEPEVLTEVYDREKENLQTLFRFSDGSIHLKGWRGSDEFCKFYPFHTYQFALFQMSIKELSAHNIFTGKYLSIGERSMLAVFQEVVKAVSNAPIGRLATFDQMYDGICASIRGDMQSTIKLAENQLGEGLNLRILKALFMLKWVRVFKANLRNIAILLIDTPDIDIKEHEKAVRAALSELTNQNYLQLDGDLYEILTDTEKDVENEIKNTQVDESQVATLLANTLFSDVLRDPKIRYEENGQDYVYARKLDDQCIGRDADIAVNIITTDHPNHDESDTLAAQNTGRSELLVVLPSDFRLIDQAWLYLRTEKYIQQNTGGGEETRSAIIEQRRQQNGRRRAAMIELAGEFLSKAPLYLNGSRLDTVGECEARSRFYKASQNLISFAYPSLAMLRGSYDEKTLSKSFLDHSDLLGSGAMALSESEQEVLNYVMRNQNNGERTSVEEICRYFTRRPYGWYTMAVLTFLGRLFQMGKVELRTTELLAGSKALELLMNSRQRGTVRVRIQEQFTPVQVDALKRFHHEFFDRANVGTDARSVAKSTSEAFATEASELKLLLEHENTYAFIKPLASLADRLMKLSAKEYNYLLSHISEYRDDLLKEKEDLISPIKTFMRGSQRAVYDEAISFFKSESENFVNAPESEIQALRELVNSPNPYCGNIVPAAKTAVAKLRRHVEKVLKDERTLAESALNDYEDKIKNTADFSALDEDGKNKVLALSHDAMVSIETARYAASVRDRLHSYIAADFPKQLAVAAKLAADGRQPIGEEKAKESKTVYTQASSLHPNCGLTYVSTEEELDRWLAELRIAALKQLQAGNRIIL